LGVVSLGRDDVDRALVRRLFENLRNLILDGVWKSGDKLPGTRSIARDAGVSRATAVAAVDLLIGEGLVEARLRSGTYVLWKGPTRANGGASSSAQTAPKPKAAFAFAVPALDLFPMQAWRKLQARRWHQMPASALEDSSAAGWPELRQAVAEFVATARNLRCTPEQVFIVPSLEAAGRLTARALCRPGASAWNENPTSLNTHAITESAQLSPIAVSVDDQGIDVDEGCRIAPNASLAVVTPAVHFPSGTRMSDLRRHALLGWARAERAWILEADHALEFSFGKAPLAAMPGADRVVYFDTFGKMLFPSLQVSYLVVPPETVSRFRAALQACDRPPPIPSQIVLADFLSSGKLARHLRRCREVYSERREALRTALAEECGGMLTVAPGQDGLFLCARLVDPTVDDVAIAARAREHGLIVAPLSIYYTGKTDARGLVLGFSGFSPDVIHDGVRRLAVVLGQAMRARRSAVG
jgi:GntR family transcriptional regulator/MocR family aminotransferase